MDLTVFVFFLSQDTMGLEDAIELLVLIVWWILRAVMVQTKQVASVSTISWPPSLDKPRQHLRTQFSEIPSLKPPNSITLRKAMVKLSYIANVLEYNLVIAVKSKKCIVHFDPEIHF